MTHSEKQSALQMNKAVFIHTDPPLNPIHTHLKLTRTIKKKDARVEASEIETLIIIVYLSSE